MRSDQECVTRSNRTELGNSGWLKDVQVWTGVVYKLIAIGYFVVMEQLMLNKGNSRLKKKRDLLCRSETNRNTFFAVVVFDVDAFIKIIRAATQGNGYFGNQPDGVGDFVSVLI